MTSMLKFLKRKIKPFKKCSGNPSCSFEVVDSRSSSVKNKNEFHTFSSEYTDATCTSQINQSSKQSKRSFFRFHMSKSQAKQYESHNTNGSLDNREKTNSLMANPACQLLTEEGEIDIDTDLPEFDTPTLSLNSNEWHSNSYSDDIYSDEDCIQDLINNTDDHKNEVYSPGNSMVTYNTCFFKNFHKADENVEAQSGHSATSLHLDVTENNNFNVKNNTGLHQAALTGFRKSNTFQNNHINYLYAQKNTQQPQKDSPFQKKVHLRQNRKCRRSNTTFTMVGMRKNRIIDYFNNLELNKASTKNCRHELFSSNREINFCELKAKKSYHEKDMKLNQEEGKNYPRNIKNDSFESKNENEKIQDLFFYDESLVSGQNNSRKDLTDDLLNESCGNLTADSVNVVLSTLMDSPVSVLSSLNSVTKTPFFDKDAEISNIKRRFRQNIQKEATSTNNSLEKFRRSLSMPIGLVEPNLSIQANDSKISSLKGFEDDLNMNMITPKKALNFDQIPDLASTTINTPNSPAGHYISSFEACDDEPRPFMRGQTRNLSNNIKQMFKNVIKVQLNALGNLEKFYEAQLYKVEADRCQNLKLHPENKKQIDEYFDKQLEMLEERVQLNLESIAREKQGKKQEINKVAHIISSGQQVCTGSKHSKNFLNLKKNLIINQKSLLPSKMCDYSPKIASQVNFKRNLSLPFKQNGVRYNDKSLNEYDFSYDNNKVNVHDSRVYVSNSLAKIVKLNTNENKGGFNVSANSAFKPYLKKESQLIANNFEVYKSMNDGIDEFKPSGIDLRRNSIPYGEDILEDRMNTRQQVIRVPRLSDSHLLFKIKQEKKISERRVVNVYQKQFKSKSDIVIGRQLANIGHVETEV